MKTAFLAILFLSQNLLAEAFDRPIQRTDSQCLDASARLLTATYSANRTIRTDVGRDRLGAVEIVGIYPPGDRLFFSVRQVLSDGIYETITFTGRVSNAPYVHIFKMRRMAEGKCLLVNRQSGPSLRF